MDVIEEVKENIEKGKEAIEEFVEGIEKGVKGKKKNSKSKKEKIMEKKKSEAERGNVKEQLLNEEPKNEELKKAAEAESLVTEKSGSELERKKKELLEKAKKLREKISEGEISTEELKKKVKIKKRIDMLIPLDEYVKSGIYIGTKVVTPDTRPFVYRRRADGLAIFNTDLIDEKLREAIEFLSKFNPENVILVCKRQVGWRAAEKFSEITGIRAFTKKYPAGILTNTKLPDFFENELTIITDSWLDRNALNDTLKVNKKVLMICDTNNFSKGANQIIIGNNKSAKSLGVIFYLLTKGYCKARGLDTIKNIPDLDWWTSEEEELIREKISVVARGARYGV